MKTAETRAAGTAAPKEDRRGSRSGSPNPCRRGQRERTARYAAAEASDGVSNEDSRGGTVDDPESSPEAVVKS